jgi:hypothetical protein
MPRQSQLTYCVFRDQQIFLSLSIISFSDAGSTILRVRAVDADSGRNGEVRYRIRQDQRGDHSYFHIDQVGTGLDRTRGEATATSTLIR